VAYVLSCFEIDTKDRHENEDLTNVFIIVLAVGRERLYKSYRPTSLIASNTRPRKENTSKIESPYVYGSLRKLQRHQAMSAPFALLPNIIAVENQYDRYPRLGLCRCSFSKKDMHGKKWRREGVSVSKVVYGIAMVCFGG
jgi:hypothetical protein